MLPVRRVLDPALRTHHCHRSKMFQNDCDVFQDTMEQRTLDKLVKTSVAQWPPVATPYIKKKSRNCSDACRIFGVHLVYGQTTDTRISSNGDVSNVETESPKEIRCTDKHEHRRHQ